MKKWQDLSAPDDAGSWFDVDGVWPTNRGTYETAEVGGGTDNTATTAGAVVYAFSAGVTDTNSVNPEYVVTAGKIWQYNPAGIPVMTDRTGGVSVGARPKMAIFGNATIAVMGAPLGVLPGVATAYAATSASNFAALAGAPQGHCVCVAYNAVWIGDTDNGSNCFEMSDIGDYTNWATGEWFAGQIFDGSGPIFAMVELGGPVYIFKTDSIHRSRYVGGQIKVDTQQVWSGEGCGQSNAAAAGATGILFAGVARTDSGTPTTPFYWYDGANPPVLTNPITSIGNINSTWTIVYDVHRDIFTVWDTAAVVAYYFSPLTMTWGRHTLPYGAAPGSVKPVDGVGLYGRRTPSPTTPGWVTPSTNILRRFSPATTSVSGYVETTKIGTANHKLNFNRLTPRIRRTTDVGTQSEAVTASFFRELHDTLTSSTATYTKSGSRYRWDGQVADNFARFKYAFTDYDVEIEDLLPEAIPSGKN